MSVKWNAATLDYLCEFKNGLWKGKKEPYIQVGVIRNTNFTAAGVLNDSDIAYLDVEEKQYASRKLQYSDLILEKSGGGPKQPVGRVVAFEKEEGEFSFSNFTSVIRIKNKSELYYSYLHKYLYFLYISGGTETMQKHSTGIRNLQLKEYKEITVNYPTINEQKRIVAILDQAFAEIEKARANAEQNLKNARELFESYLQQVFSQPCDEWVNMPLGNILNIKHGFAFKSEFFVNMSKYVLLTPGNFYEEGGYRDRGEKQKYYKGDFPSNYILSKGNLLVAMTEQAKGLLGSPALIPEDNQFLHNQRLGLVQLEEKYKSTVNLKFLYYLFNTKYFRSKVQETATGLKVRHTSPKKLMAIVVSIPVDIQIQKTIVSKLDKIKNASIELEDIFREKTVNLEKLKKSILQKAFTGELTKETAT